MLRGVSSWVAHNSLLKSLTDNFQTRIIIVHNELSCPQWKEKKKKHEIDLVVPWPFDSLFKLSYVVNILLTWNLVWSAQASVFGRCSDFHKFFVGRTVLRAVRAKLYLIEGSKMSLYAYWVHSLYPLHLCTCWMRHIMSAS